MKILFYTAKLIYKLWTKISIYLPAMLAIIGVVIALFSDVSIYCFVLLIVYVNIIIAYLTRDYSTNVVFNYVLENKIHLPRLKEIGWVFCPDEKLYKPTLKKNGIITEGYLKYRKISKLEYYLVMWFLWKWVDNDTNNDTTDKHLIMDKVINKESYPSFPEWVRNIVRKERSRLETYGQYGNAWYIGDARKREWYWISSILWLIRNTCYNYNYMFEECAEDSKMFFYKRFTTKYFDWHFGYIPYSNPSRKGRMVWFTEDIDKIGK